MEKPASSVKPDARMAATRSRSLRSLLLIGPVVPTRPSRCRLAMSVGARRSRTASSSAALAAGSGSSSSAPRACSARISSTAISPRIDRT